jgi:hypothetical protein
MEDTSEVNMVERQLKSSLVSLIIIASSFCYAMGYAVGQDDTSIRGQGHGNNGLRFPSLVDCGDSTKHFFSGGSRLIFSSNIQDTSKKDHKIFGFWEIELRGSEENMTKYKSGTLTDIQIIGNNYSLSGLELEDDICSQGPTTIEITGRCQNESLIYFRSSDGSKVGSITPNDSEPVYLFFGSEILCKYPTKTS